MSDDFWSAQDTNPDAIEAALRLLLHERHAANEALAPARVINLVVVVDREWKGEVANRLGRVGRYLASRTVLCAVQDGRRTLDAIATVTHSEPAPGMLGVMHERVEIDMGAEHLPALLTIVDPVLVGEIPTVVWSPHGHRQAVDALMPVMDVVLVDSDDGDEPAEAFSRAEQLRRHAYVVDLAWLRTTPWRERLAASFDMPARLRQLSGIARLDVRHRDGSRASALLLAGWLASRLAWDCGPLRPAGPVLDGFAARGEDRVGIGLEPSEQDAPGLVGVTVSCGDGASLALQRGRGGLDAVERRASGEERRWKILGASRGEGGILGEGLRQALLRDPTYVPALDAARALTPVPA